MKWLTDPATGNKVRYVSRKECGLPKSRAPSGKFKRAHAIAHHGVGNGNGLSLSSIKSLWRGYHRYHTQNRGWNDIGYSAGWADAPDVGGAVLEGRSWGKDGAHTQNGGNRLGYAGCYVGDGRKKIASTAWRAWRAWIQYGIEEGAFPADIEFSGHSDWYDKLCPGSNILDPLQEMSSYDVDEEKELIMDYGPPLTVVKSEKENWYLIENWSAKYRYIKTPEALKNLKHRGDSDEPQIVTRSKIWEESWFVGMIRLDDV